MWPFSFAFAIMSPFHFIHFCCSCSCLAYIIFTLCIYHIVILPSKELKALYSFVSFDVYSFFSLSNGKVKAAYNNIVPDSILSSQ